MYFGLKAETRPRACTSAKPFVVWLCGWVVVSARVSVRCQLHRERSEDSCVRRPLGLSGRRDAGTEAGRRHRGGIADGWLSVVAARCFVHARRVRDLELFCCDAYVLWVEAEDRVPTALSGYEF